jgi:hypothetical protein
MHAARRLADVPAEALAEFPPAWIGRMRERQFLPAVVGCPEPPRNAPSPGWA